jgi:hypothetical protein
MHLVTYHGVLAPSARDRDLIVPVTLPGRSRHLGNCGGGGNDERQDGEAEGALAEAARSVVQCRGQPDRDALGPEVVGALVNTQQPEPEPHTPTEGAKLRHRYSWAELLKRVFLADVLVCDRCGGRRKLLSFILDTEVIIKILNHLGLPTEPPLVHPARAPPEATDLDILD